MRLPAETGPYSLLLFTVLVIVTGALVFGHQSQRLSDARLERLKTLGGAPDHTPGASDRHLVALAAWDADDVWEAVGDLLESRRHVPNRLLRCAAMLHADVALLATHDRSRETVAHDSLLVLDGVVVQPLGQSAHWAAARRLLDAIDPSPEKDTFVQRWYEATAAAMLQDGNLAAAKPHLERALDVLPRQASIQFLAGFYHQANVGPTVLPVLRMRLRAANGQPRIWTWGSAATESADWHRKRAERHLREAVRLDPGHAEARMRLGLALLEADEAGEAARHLRVASDAVPDGELAYFIQLLLGRAEERLGHAQEAEACYGRAAVLEPSAVSPRLARAALTRLGGDGNRALEEVRSLAAPPVPPQMDADPWWIFFRWQSRPAGKMLAELRGMAALEGSR